MSSRNDRFNKSMISLEEFIDTFEDPSKIAVFSDRGTGVPPVRHGAFNGQDARCPGDSRQAKLHAAIMRLRRANRGYLIPVLQLIVRNGDLRDLSLAKVPRRTYFRHRDALLRFFCGTPPCYRLRGGAIEVRYSSDSPLHYAPCLQRLANTVRNQAANERKMK